MAEPRYLLDSNICIYLLNGQSNALVRRVEECLAGEVVTSVIVYAEVMLGAERLGATRQAQAFFRLFPVLPFDVASGAAYARLPFKRGNFDRLIAAQAVQHSLTVVTNNEGDFADVPGLKVENWTL